MKIPGFSGVIHTTPSEDWSRASGPVSLAPSLVVEPHATEDVVAAVRWAAVEGRAITPRAAGTGMPAGNVSRDILMNLGPASAFAHIGALDVDARRVTVGPGAIAAEVDRRAAAVGLTLPGLPSSAERCTIGGMIANNAAGARSFRHGAVATRVRSMKVVDATGVVHHLVRNASSDDPFVSAARASTLGPWPTLRKNSSGYRIAEAQHSGDGVDLLVGSEGTLGIVVEATLDLAPRPNGHDTMLIGLPDIEEVLGWTQIARELELSACEFVGPWLLDKAGLAKDPEFGRVAAGARYVLILEAEGPSSTRDAAVAAVTAHAERHGQRWLVARAAQEQDAVWGLRRRASPVIAEAARRGFRSMQFIEDSVVPPEQLHAYLTGVAGLLDQVGFQAAIFGHAGDANVHINPLVPMREDKWLPRVRELLEGTAHLVRDLGGTLAGEHGDGRIRAPYLETVWGQENALAFSKLKRALDPMGILNPGVVVPIAGHDPLDGLAAQPPTR